jgi:hypothetical protein
MKNQRKFSQSVVGVTLATLLILLVPLVAMQFTDEVNWSVADFILMGALLFGTGFAYVVVIRHMTNMVYRSGMALAFGTTLFMIWANLAVGLIGSGPNLGNLLYFGVVVVVIISTVLSRLKPEGMERAMYASAIAVVLVAVIALLANMHEYSGSSMVEIVGVSMFFATPYTIAGLLFRNVAEEQSTSA